MTIHLAYQQLVAQLYAVYQQREGENIAELVMEHVTGQRRIDRIMYRDLPVNSEQEDKINTCIEQLLQHRPVQYVLSEAWFANMMLYVDEHVLIPRPETEELVDWIVKDVKAVQPRRADKFCVLDIGTGSGCIAIAIKKRLPAHLLTAVDVSEAALEVARKNALVQHAQITFFQLDFLKEHEREQLEMFDIITSNPPYIKESEAHFMESNVLQFEPHVALFVPDDNALVFYKAIAHFAQEHLTPNGSIYVEINEALGPAVRELFTTNGFRNVELRKDLQGKDRMVKVSGRL